MNKNILENIAIIVDRMNKACQKSGRNPNDVKLLLATKTVDAERIKVALDAGYTMIAENRVQELKETHQKQYNFLMDGKINMRQVFEFIGIKSKLL